MGGSKGLPCSLDSERLILGAVLMDDACFARIGELPKEAFSLEKHRRIWARMMEMRERDEHIDRITIANELLKYNELESCDGLTYLVSLDDGMPVNFSVDSVARIVREKHLLRNMIFMAQKLAQAAQLEDTPAAKILADFGRALTRMEARAGGTDRMHTPLQIMEQHAGGLPGFLQNAIRPGIPTGYPQMDELTMGLQENGHYIIAGATGSGKSSLAENIAINVALRGHPVSYFSLEMSEEQLIARAVCSIAKVSLKPFAKGQLMPDQRREVMAAAEKLATLPLYIDDTPDLGAEDFVSRVNRAVQEKGVRLVVLDYLQIMGSQDRGQKFQKEYDRVTYNSQVCRTVARKHPISTLVLSQLSRPADKRKAADPPQLSDLRASGGIEQDAYAVSMIHRPELYMPGKSDLRGVANVYVRKSRNGATGVAELEFISRYTTFVDHGKEGARDDDDD